MGTLIKYILLICIGYLVFSLVFTKRIDTPYFSVIMSDGWTTAHEVKSDDSGVQAVFANKRTGTIVEVTVTSDSLSGQFANLKNTFQQIGAALTDPDLETDSLINAGDYSYVTYRKNGEKGIYYTSKDGATVAVINIHGPEHGDGTDLVNTFFNKNQKLFPVFADPSSPSGGMNYILWIRKIKTAIHEYVNPKEWFGSES